MMVVCNLSARYRWAVDRSETATRTSDVTELSVASQVRLEVVLRRRLHKSVSFVEYWSIKEVRVKAFEVLFRLKGVEEG